MIRIDQQLQLFLDETMIENRKNAELRLHSPQPAEIAISRDRPYETPNLYDPVVILDDGRYRLWYRTNFESPPFYTGYAESADGIHWTKPDLGLIECAGSTRNSLVWPIPGGEGHVLSIFKDGNPASPDSERYKAIGIGSNGKEMVALVSPDGLRWTNLRKQPVIVAPENDPYFDSHNIAFWDAARGCYVAYLRGWPTGFQGIRHIRRATSNDFRSWSAPEYIDLGDTPPEHLYKNAATPYYRRPDLIFMFPKRFLPGRKFHSQIEQGGLSDIVFMHSRDGRRFDRRFLEAFVRPGRDPKNWRDRAIEVGSGLVPTGEGEMSLYLVENYQWPSVRIRRMVLREDGIVSLHAGYRGGESTTRTLVFRGRELVLNYATSAAGSVRVELQAEDGSPLPGFRLEESAVLYGDETARVASWGQGADLSALAGRPIRLRFVLMDADIYSYRFRE